MPLDERSAKIDSGGRFTDAAFLLSNGVVFRHTVCCKAVLLY
jgi:hypothetical protein